MLWAWTIYILKNMMFCGIIGEIRVHSKDKEPGDYIKSVQAKVKAKKSKNPSSQK